ncbi:MAG: TetR family transcriptional regulator [Actinobacteria bacterium]|nr:TetR family transcriptional regulator [Actinomycetota bacterium]
MSTGERRAAPATAKRAAAQAAVLRATEELLAEGAAFSDLAVERIAGRAGISRTAFYFHFADKRDLLRALTGEVNALVHEQAARWLEGDGDPQAQLRSALRGTRDLFREHAVLVRAIVEVAAYDDAIAQLWRETVGQLAAAAERRIELERQRGASTCADPHATAVALTWMTERTLYEQVGPQPAVDDDALVEALAAIWTRAIYG